MKNNNYLNLYILFIVMRAAKPIKQNPRACRGNNKLCLLSLSRIVVVMVALVAFFLLLYMFVVYTHTHTHTFYLISSSCNTY
jgi:hypothetical protein